MVYGTARKVSGLAFSLLSVTFDDIEMDLRRENKDLPFGFLVVVVRLRPLWEVVVRKAILSKLMVVWVVRLELCMYDVGVQFVICAMKGLCERDCNDEMHADLSVHYVFGDVKHGSLTQCRCSCCTIS